MATTLEHRLTRTATLRSKVTTKSQTTLPSGVRKALRVASGDELEYVIEGDHAVIRKVIDADAEDPVLGAFLNLLAADMADHPGRLRRVGSRRGRTRFLLSFRGVSAASAIQLVSREAASGCGLMSVATRVGIRARRRCLRKLRSAPQGERDVGGYLYVLT